MPVHDEVNEFLMGNGAKAFDFSDIGVKVSGVIVEMKKQQQTDMQTGEPQFWNNGEPKMMLRVTLQTDMRTSDDDEGLRSVYLRGGNFTAVTGKGTSSLVAVKDAVRRSGKGIEPGGRLTLEFSGLGQAPSKGFNPPKLYVADYQPPSQTIDMDEMA